MVQIPLRAAATAGALLLVPFGAGIARAQDTPVEQSKAVLACPDGRDLLVDVPPGTTGDQLTQQWQQTCGVTDRPIAGTFTCADQTRVAFRIRTATPADQERVRKTACPREGDGSGGGTGTVPDETGVPAPSKATCPASFAFTRTGNGDIVRLDRRARAANGRLRSSTTYVVPKGVALTVKHRGVTWRFASRPGSWELRGMCFRYNGEKNPYLYLNFDKGSVKVTGPASAPRSGFAATDEALIAVKSRGRISFTYSRTGKISTLRVTKGYATATISPSTRIKDATCKPGRAVRITLKGGIKEI